VRFPKNPRRDRERARVRVAVLDLVAGREVVEREEAPVALADVVERVEEAPERGEVRSFVATVIETLAATAPDAQEFREIGF
jgi:hypothetical protein